MFEGKVILDPSHLQDLERQVYEFCNQHQMTQEQAENSAYNLYLRLWHAKAAAYHLQAMEHFKLLGEAFNAQRHYLLYQLHLKELGYSPSLPVPPEVASQKLPNQSIHHFAQHPADRLINFHV